jgi:hypothetical protein
MKAHNMQSDIGTTHLLFLYNTATRHLTIQTGKHEMLSRCEKESWQYWKKQNLLWNAAVRVTAGCCCIILKMMTDHDDSSGWQPGRLIILRGPVQGLPGIACCRFTNEQSKIVGQERQFMLWLDWVTR